MDFDPRNTSERKQRNPDIAIGLGVALLSGALVVTALSTSLLAQNAQSDRWAGTPQEAFLNSEIVRTYGCNTCHTVAGGGGTVGPILDQLGNRRSEEWIRDWLKDPQQVKPGTKMPTFPFTGQQLELAVSHLTSMRRDIDTAPILASTMTAAEKGGAIFEQYDCLACHRVGDDGRFVGPDLTWIGLRKERSWERVWLHDPEAWKAGTFMPNFDLSDGEIEPLTAFLEQLQGQDNEAGQIWEMRAAFFLGGEPADMGAHVFKRFACWGCHGAEGKGGERNPNAAPDELMPALTESTSNHTEEEMRQLLSGTQRPDKKDPSGEAPPFFCPPYANHMDGIEFRNLYAYLESLVPEGSKWIFR